MKFVIATNNKKKLAELSRILKPLGIEADTIEGFGFESMDAPDENGTSFQENAKIKAFAACQHTNMPSIADDSGLCVDALGGNPGIHSARYGGEGLSDKDRYLKLLEDLKDIPQAERCAHFMCSIMVVFPDGREISANGKCMGYIGEKAQGDGGFGYDPIFFLPDGRCFAELSASEKDEVSHRGNALRELKKTLQQTLNDKLEG